jgi:hypothetical protein
MSDAQPQAGPETGLEPEVPSLAIMCVTCLPLV